MRFQEILLPLHCGVNSREMKRNATERRHVVVPGPPPCCLTPHSSLRNILLGLAAPALSYHKRLQEDRKTLGTVGPRPQLFSVTFGGKT